MASTLTTLVLQAILRKRYRELRTITVPAVSEARCAWLLESALKNFVFGAEGARCDAALVMNSLPDLGEQSTTRLFKSIERFKGQNVALSFDIKTISVSEEVMPFVRLCTYNVMITPYQSHNCAFYIIVSLMAPHLVALVPGRILVRGPESLHRPFRPTIVVDDDAEPFPMELFPFVMPVECLPQAVAECQKFAQNPENGWRNHFTRQILRGLPSPGLLPIECLLPDPRSGLSDLADEVWAWNAFRTCSDKWEVQRLMIKPGVGDFLLAQQRPDGERIRFVVEMKNGRCRILDGGIINHRGLSFPLDTVCFGKLFSAFTTADFLLSIMHSTALFLPLDLLPAEWFTSQDASHNWRPSREFLDQHLLPWGGTAQAAFVRGVESTLDRYIEGGKNSIDSRRRFFMAPPPEDIVRFLKNKLERPEHEFEIDVPGEPIPDDDELISQRTPLMPFEAKVSRELKQQCAQRGFGRIYRLGLHQRATYVYVPVMLATQDVGLTHLPDLYRSTPVLWLNFARIEITDESEPRIIFREQFNQAVQGAGASLYLLFPSELSITGQRLDCFIVPSTVLDEDGLLSNVVLRKAPSVDKRFRLRSCEPLSSYAHSEDTIVAFLENVCRGAVTDGGGSQPLYDSRQLDGAVGSLLAVMQSMIELEAGAFTWTHVRAAPMGVTCSSDDIE